ncbi:MAG: shikimate dehydrogenase [Zetaproteobacteria bacterium CG1_02_55_237]|nr:MAG: shikimate dehydrogenase [Zetaproteobacteria bacterium CG1_02_55_237]
MEVTGKTRVFGIIGDPISHSLSPLFQARFAKQHGIDAVYIPLRVMAEDVATALAGLWAANVEGFNVTVPHKESVAALVQMDEAASLIGAVNTVRRVAGGWQGTNTDWQGVRDAMHDLDVDLNGSEVLLIGAGGTARAVLHALAAGSARKVYICNRNPERLNCLMQHAARTYPAMEVSQLAWEKEKVAACALRCAVVINTTSIGLDKEDGAFPFAIGGKGVALDAVYSPDGRTPFVAAARQGGRVAVDGLPMLLAQGAASFAWWHDVRVDVVPVMMWLEERLGRCRADRLQ